MPLFTELTEIKKILVIGCSGSGKSTFAGKLSRITHIPLYHLDMIWYRPDRTTLTKEDFDKQLETLMQREDWILDGNYQRTLENRLKRCDTVFLLNFPTEICLEGVKSRIGKERIDFPWLETELEETFKQRICDFRQNSLPKILALLERYRENLEIYIFQSRNEIEEYLKSLSK